MISSWHSPKSLYSQALSNIQRRGERIKSSDKYQLSEAAERSSDARCLALFDCDKFSRRGTSLAWRKIQAMVPLKPCQQAGGHIAQSVRLAAVACYYHRDKEWSLGAETSAVTVEGLRGGRRGKGDKGRSEILTGVNYVLFG